MPPLKPLRIPAAALAQIRQLAATAMPREACGLLIGREEGEVSRLEAAENVATEPTRRFEIDPRRLLQLHRGLRGGAEELIGHWHSHPDGPAVPSACDREMVADPAMVWLIIAAPSGEARAWRVVDNGFAEVPVEAGP